MCVVQFLALALHVCCMQLRLGEMCQISEALAGIVSLRFVIFMEVVRTYHRLYQLCLFSHTEQCKNFACNRFQVLSHAREYRSSLQISTSIVTISQEKTIETLHANSAQH